MPIRRTRAAPLLLALAGSALAAPAGAQDWFEHPFGELRSYHLDWLAICADTGAGPCRVVYSAADIGSGAAFDRRLTLRYDEAAGTWMPEVMDRGMPESGLRRLAFVFDGDTTVLALPTAYMPGEAGTADALGRTAEVAETVSITDPDLAARLNDEMRAGRTLAVRYLPLGTGDGVAEFSLRGVRAAQAAVESHVAKRKGDG